MTWTKSLLTKSKSFSNFLSLSNGSKKKDLPIFRKEIDENGKEKTFVGRFILTNQILGVGGNSVVQLGYDSKTMEKVAIKCIKTSRPKNKHDPTSGSGLTEETTTLKNLIHPFVYRFIEAYRTDQYVYVIFEYVEGKMLFDKITSDGFLTEEESRKIFSQILNVISYLHSNNILHNDIKPENIIISSQNSLKLIDFGHSTFMINNVSENIPYSTLSYNAPEVINEKRATTSSDIWSLGVTLFAMVTGSLPFHDQNEDSLIEKISSGDFDYSKSKKKYHY